MMISMLPGNVIALTDDSVQIAETEQAVTPATEEKSLAYSFYIAGNKNLTFN